MTRYLLDTNYFIQAHRSYYPLDVVESFWVRTKELAKNGHIISIDKVKKEIYDKASHEDELKIWCGDNLENEFFNSTDIALPQYIQIVQWVNSMRHQYHDSAIEEFLQADLADPWLVAYAMKENLVIVTYEKSAPDSKKRVKIPEVCNRFGVRFIDTIGMMRELNSKF
ncbi:DUF4411 family protein [Salegentibacter salarius]|nr:DUF4411 family protein [Salegentibacter salarius]PKD20589.1 hypothetical protein APR40_08840 [Salegentibacter salarius]SLJ95866.1 protein of unknown function [Salegentibacter salarius]